MMQQTECLKTDENGWDVDAHFDKNRAKRKNEILRNS